MQRRKSGQSKIEKNRKIIGISNTYLRGKPWLSHAEKGISKWVKKKDKIVLIPYALHDRDHYAQKLSQAFQRMGFFHIDSVHYHPGKEKKLIKEADAIFIAGGNTSRLIANLHCLKNKNGEQIDKSSNASSTSLVAAIRKRVSESMPIMGSSAGINVFSNDVRTTNDMHIAVQQLDDGSLVSRLDALGLFPNNLSINPHFLDKVVLTEKERKELKGSLKKKILAMVDHQGETRRERLEQAIEIDSSRKILALREGAYIMVNGMNMELKGKTGGLIFSNKNPPIKINEGTNISFLLH